MPLAFSSITALGSTAILRVLLIWYQSQHVAVLIRRLNDIFESEPEQGRDHSQLAAVQVGFLMDAGAIAWREEELAANGKDKGCFALDLERLPAAIDAMAKAGAVIVDKANLTTVGQFDDAESLVLDYEFKAGVNAYLASLGAAAPVKSLTELIAWNEKNAAREMPWFAQEIFVRANARGALTDRAYLDARARCVRLARTEGIDAVMAAHRLDAIICPSNQPAWPTDPLNGDHFTGGNTSFAAVAGYPSITVPVGYGFGLPVGMSFVGKAWSEPTLLRLAYAYEQATRYRRAPVLAA